MKRIYETPLCRYVPFVENDVITNSIGSEDPSELLFSDSFN